MIRRTLLILTGVCFMLSTRAQDTSLYLHKMFMSKGDSMGYRLLIPKKYDQHKKYPLILFLHGSGEKGNDNSAQLTHGGNWFLTDSIREKYPAIVIVPQCPTKSNWVDNTRVKDSTGKFVLVMKPDAPAMPAMATLQKLLKNVIHHYKIKRQQIYVGGLSLGGMGTYDIVKRNPRLFAAAFPICGAADPSIAPKLKYVSWWVFHGAEDSVVPADFSRNMVAEMQRFKIPVRFTLYTNTGHNSWDKAFAEPGLFAWMFSNTK